MYYRLSYMSRTWYAKAFNRFGMSLLEDIQELVDGGDPVLVTDELEKAAYLLDIDVSDIVIVGDE